MRAARLRPLLAMLVLCGAGLLAGCGKGSTASSAGGGPARKVAALTAQGAVSVVTRNTTRLGGADAATDAAAVARTVFPALTVATRPQVVVLVDERDWPAALAASVLAGAPLNAPILYSEGNTLPAVSREALEGLDPLGSSALGGIQVLRVGTTAPVPRGYVTQTLPAAEASVAAVALQHEARSAGAARPRQVIVVPVAAPRALQMPAAGLSAQGAAPIVFVTASRVPPATADALAALHRPSLYLIDPAAVDRATADELRRLGTVSDIGGHAGGEQPNASENAVAIARFTDGQFGWGIKEPNHGLVFANASRPLDAPAAAPLSATGDYGPLLLLEGAGQIPDGLAKYLGDIEPAYTNSYVYRPAVGSYNHGWLIGDQAAISAVVQAEIDSVLEISPSRQASAEPSTQGE